MAESAQPSFDLDLAQRHRIDQSRQRQIRVRAARQSGSARGGRFHPKDLKPRQQFRRVHAPRVAEVHGLPPRQGLDATTVLLDLVGKRGPGAWHAMPMGMELHVGASAGDVPDLVRIHDLEHTPANQLVVVDAEQIGDRSDAVVLFHGSEPVSVRVQHDGVGRLFPPRLVAQIN